MISCLSMNEQIIYFSRKGSTKKIADAIASELNIQAEEVNNAVLKKQTTIFLGSGFYGGKPGELMTKFIEDNDFKGISIALFGTSGGGDGKEVLEMEKKLIAKDAIIKGKFFCKGKFIFMNRRKPDDHDVNDAKQFAKNIKLKI
jgi:flavodoxin